MIRDLLWKGYALLYVGLLVIGMAVSFRQETWTATDYVSAGFAATYLVGLAGHAYRTPILRRGFWRVMFWLLIVGLVSMGALVFLAQSPDAPDATLLGLLFTLPLAVALHTYSAAGNPLWSEMELLSKAQALDRMLGATGVMEATHAGKIDGRETHTSVTVSRHHQGYAIDISRTIDGTELRNTDIVGDPRALIRAVETQTPLQIADFRPRTGPP